MRTRAASRLRDVLDQKGTRCHWCGLRVVRVSSIPIPQRRHVGHAFILWRDPYNNAVRHALVATTDHVIPQCVGGAEDPSNLVPACRYCNEARGRQYAGDNQGWHENELARVHQNESMLDERDRVAWSSMRALLSWIDDACSIRATDPPAAVLA